MFSFLQEVRVEMSKVTWPTRQEVTRLTLIVIGISIVVGLYLGAADYLFTLMLEYLLS